MPEPSSFDYSIIRVVPRVERGERINAGIVLYCRARDFLGAGVALDRSRLSALAPELDADLVEAHLRSVQQICEGGKDSGPIGQGKSVLLRRSEQPEGTFRQTPAWAALEPGPQLGPPDHSDGPGLEGAAEGHRWTAPHQSWRASGSSGP